MGSKQRLAERAAAGILNARERIDRLLDEGSFSEVGLHAVSANPDHREKSPADGVITGFGEIDGREVAVIAHDFTTLGASTASTYTRKTSYLERRARESGLPLIQLGEAGGARLPDSLDAAGFGAMAMGAKEAWGRTRSTPWISAVLGSCFGGPTRDTMRSDYVVMRKGAQLGVSSEQMTSVAVSADSDDEYCGWKMHTEETGCVDGAVDDDEAALDRIRALLAYLPSHALETPPIAPVPEGSAEAAKRLLEIVPEDRRKVYDMLRVIEAIVDTDSFFPFKERFAKVVMTGLARLDGQTVGIIASNPRVKAGSLDPDACDKATSFVVFCDSFNIPLILLADTPGFLVGMAGERRKLPGRIVNLLDALALASVPILGLVLRKSYGLAYLAFGGGIADALATWPTAEVSLMDPAVAVNVLHGVRREDDPERFALLVQELERDVSGYALASGFASQDVIDPRESRDWLVRMLRIGRRRLSGGIGKHRLSSWPTTL
jgi:acetyl-CoA carboxylase carboxyltransferase component